MDNPRAYTLRQAHWPVDIPLLKKVRETVFVIEQHVPIELEWDDMDAVSEHILAMTPKGDAIGTGRLLPDGHIGRMAVLPSYRGHGIGGAILEQLLARAQAKQLSQVVLSAQLTAVPFYERFKFRIRGMEYMDAGIPHIEMTLKLKNPAR